MRLCKFQAVSITLSVVFLLFSIPLFSQFEALPCTNPDNNGVGCYCETAGVLCTPDALNGFSFGMSSVPNYGGLGDGPGGVDDDLCPELTDGGNPHNVNFFAFVVWCETLTFDVIVSNCGPGINSSNFNNFGIQMALFADCPALNDAGLWNTVECITSGQTCFNSAADVPSVQTFSASGLEIGATYYFMLDGCYESTCKVKIEVQGTCGSGEIADWTNGIMGGQSVCIGDTETYTAEDGTVGLDGAEEYYYYLDGVLIDEGEELYTTNITWDTPGTYELCVDVSNLPCILESDNPVQDCITIFVNGPGVGDVIADPAILCPEETSTITIENTVSDPALSQYIIIIGPDGTVVQVVNDLTTTLTYNMCGIFTAYYYSFVTADNPTLPNVGDTWTLPDCLANCCSLSEADITFEDDEDPVFTLEPDPFTTDCPEDITLDEPLSWTDNCTVSGMVDPVVVEDYTLCDGGTIERTWTVTDSCDNIAEHVQLITIDQIPLAEFTTMPADITIDCSMAETFVPDDLDYTNSSMGVCLIEGTESPTSVGTFDICGSSVTYTWQYIDDCNRSIMHTQVVTVEEVGAANEFIDPPGPITLSCEDWLNFTPVDLLYSNDLTGTCDISGFVPATTTDDLDACGSTVTFSWQFTDQCSRTINHSQIVTIEETPEATFVDPPGPLTITCDELQTFTPMVLTYTNGGTDDCLIEGTIDPVGDGTLEECGNSVTYTWDYTDDCGRPLTHSQTVTVEEIPEATFVDPPGPLTINCDELQTFTPMVLTYTNGGTGDCLIEGTIDPVGDGTLDECGNSVTYTWDYTDDCGRPLTHSQIVTVEEIPEATFVDPPGPLTINCDEYQTFTPMVLTYTNGGTGDCLIEGTIDPVGDGTLDECGNSVMYTWDYMDDCGRPLTHSQTVTVEEIPEATFVDPPGPLTITCDELQTFTPMVLTYTNGGTGDCLIEGTIDPVGDGTLNICGNSVTYTWDYTDDCGRPLTHSQTVTVEEIPEATFVDPPGPLTINCDEFQTFTPMVLTYTNGGTGDCLIEGTIDPIGDGTLDECGNSVMYTWDYTDDCGRPLSHSQTVTVEPIPEPAFVDPPGPLTINCDELQTFAPMVLTYTNGGTGDCLIEGMIDPVGDGTLDECGNSVTYTWDYTDDCGRPLSHSQTVTVEEIPEATFIDPPGPLTINCDEFQTFTPMVLTYTNGGTGDCLIEGTIDPVGDGTLNICGNSVTYTWDYTDDCGRPLSHSQTVTVEEIPEATFVDPPGPLIINCDEFQTFTPMVLTYTNGGTGDCLIEGTIDPIGDGTLNICGNSVTYTWDYTDDCGRPLTHSQTVTVEEIPEAAFLNPPGDITINCDQLQTFDAAVLEYTNGGSGDCLIEGEVDPVANGELNICGNSVTYTWEYIDDCNRPINHMQTVTVEPINPPAFIDPPADITLSCDEKPNEGEGPELNYTNGGMDNCQIAGAEEPSEVYDITECGGSITYTWEYTDDCGTTIIEEQIITIEPAPKAQFENLPPSTITIECDENMDAGPELIVTNNLTGECLIEESITPIKVGDAGACSGSYEFVWEYVDACGRLTDFSQTVNVNPAPEATFDNPPDDIEISCNEVNDPPEALTYSNGVMGDCGIMGSEDGVRSGTVDYCGGTLIDTWEYIDECGRTIAESRTVTVLPAPQAQFNNPPGPVIVDCNSVNTVPLNLTYSNGENGICQISGLETAVVSGSYDLCGGTFIYTWTFVDLCGEPITHSQEITVNPAPDPLFIDPPTDITIGCEDNYAGAENLNYTNGLSGVCSSMGFVPAVTTQVDNVITNTWELVLQCSGESITHVQTVTLSIVPEISINPATVFLCQGDSYDLSEVEVTDANNTNIVVTYHDALPPNASNETTAVVTPFSDFIYAINVTNEYGCQDFELVNVFVELPPIAGDDQATTVCSDGIPLNLFDFIAPFIDQGGNWLDIDGIGANVSNPFAATFNNVPAGNYNLYYVVSSTTVCENDTMVLNIEVIDDVAFEITDVTCVAPDDFYEVYLNSNGFDIQATQGNVTNISGNEYVITDIPITTGVFVSAFETVSGCSATIFVDIPNCDCPDIDPPTANNVSICVNDQPYILSVNVPTGMTANWYNQQNDNAPFLSGSTDYEIDGLIAGNYSFFVETYDPATDCSSNIKVQVDVEINDLPSVMDNSIIICDIGDGGAESVSLQSFNGLINGSTANVFTYFNSLGEATNNNGPLADDYVLSIGSNFVYLRVENSANCVSLAELELVLNDLPTVDITPQNPSCIGVDDGSITITPSDVDGVLMTSLDGVTYGTDVIYNNLSAGDYTIYIKDENGCENSYEVTIDPGLDILFFNFTAICDNNGTDTDPTDDFYTINLLIENNQGNVGTYNVIYNGGIQYTFTYGDSESFTLPVDAGNTIDIMIEDVANGCTQNQTFGPLNPCSTNCEITIDQLDFTCDDNDTGTDPSDDFYTVDINASSMNGSNNNTYNVFIDGVLLYTFMYGEAAAFSLPADGANVNITLQDNEDTQCQTAQDIGPLVACSGGCQIVLEEVDVMCFNNGTSTDQTDDFYTYTLIGNIINGDNLLQYELFVDGVSQGIYNYAEEIMIDIPADGASHIISISDSGDSGCADSYTTDDLINCSTDCEIVVDSQSEMCFDNGTPQDSDDDYYEITINASAVNGATNQLYNVYVDGDFLDDYPYESDIIVTIPADGAAHVITLQDSESLTCEFDINTSILTSCSDQCQSEVIIQDITCFDNNTSTDITDDYYELEIIGSLLNGSNNTTFELWVDAVLQGVYAYGDIVMITIPADGAPHNIEIIDETDITCISDVTTDALLSCSTDCEILAGDVTYECFDNDTPTDPSDDIIEVSLSASAINGATTNMYNLYFDGVLEGIYNYGQTYTFSLPADGQIVDIRFQDSQSLPCEFTLPTDPLDPCSDDCLIGLDVVNIECFNNNTPTDVTDDFYNITIQGSVLNGPPSGGFDVFLDNVSVGTSAYAADFIVNIPADGNMHLITIVDDLDPSCEAEFTTDALTSCSTDCEISVDGLSLECFDNGTLDDPSDDFYEVTFTASAINGATGYTLTAAGSGQGNYNYGQLVTLMFPADGSNLILSFTDNSDAQCILNEVVGVLSSCSDLCTIEPMINGTQCFDNGTPIDPTDDYYEVTIFVNPANGVSSPEYILTIDGTLEGTYPYSEDVTITIPADNSTHLITVSDSNDPNCDAEVTTLVLTPCSTPCEISVSFDNIICNNNGTNDISDDDIYYADILVSNPSAGQYSIPSISITGNFNEVINIGPFNISDGAFLLEVFDVDQPLCFTGTELLPPAPCSDCVQTVDAGQGGVISCDVTEINLTGTSSEVGMYAWYGPAGNLVSESIEANAVSVGIYTFTVTYDDGCVAIDQVEVMADTDLPIALVVSEGGITCAQPIVSLDGSASGSTDDFIFYWYDEDGNLLSQEQVYTTDIPGVYILQVEDKINNCLSAQEAVVIDANLQEPTAIIYAEPSNVIDCVIESIILTHDEEANVNYTWNVNGEIVNNQIIEIDAIGTYGLVAVDTLTGCVADADIIITSLVDYPNISLDAPDVLDCDNSEITIIASSLQSGDNFSSFWQDENLNIISEDQAELFVTEPGEYYYTLMDNDNGCENTDSITIELFENDVEISVVPEITYVEGQTVQLDATVNLNTAEIEQINWSPDENMTCPTCLSTRITDPTDSIYTIVVEDIYGCLDSAEVRLIRTERPEIYIPNVFNPNSNTGNSVFSIFGNDEMERILKFQVFDRWGNNVYLSTIMELNNTSSGWDGQYNGQNVEQGVYVYLVEVQYVDGRVEVISGDLTVVW